MNINLIDDYINQNENEWNESKYKRFIELEFYILNLYNPNIDYNIEPVYKVENSTRIYYDFELKILFEEYVWSIKEYRSITYNLNTPYKHRQLYLDVIDKIIQYTQIIKKDEDEFYQKREEKREQVKPILDKLNDDDLKVLKQFYNF